MTKTHAELLKAVQDRCAEEIKEAKAATEKSSLGLDKQYHIGRTHAAKDIWRDISQLKFEDKQAEFLEELKKYVDEQVSRLDNIRRSEYGDGSLTAYANVQQLFEQFQAEQKQVGDE